ncbi:hypothetical protein [Shewanella spartinae]|uniref:hypothetical protein n=1 Tax=Shewanella spartinae TaxID=2864205 RepID=UPI001C657C51|nr:hypothetical protein [Shewanella spartinae]QYJ94762.1 hypothetical protein K0I31_05055 [Shewanella spartinae]
MMINSNFEVGIGDLAINMDTLPKSAPFAHELLSNMHKKHRQIMLFWLNGYSTSPMGYGIADVEVIKEDGYVSELRNGYLIDFSVAQCGKLSKHYMTPEQIDLFLKEPLAMKVSVWSKLNDEKLQRDSQQLKSIKLRRGFGWIMEKLGIENPMDSANDD